MFLLLMVRLTSKKRKGDATMNEMDYEHPRTNNTYKGKIYKRRSEALSEYNLSLLEQPSHQPKDYEEVEY